LRVSPAGGAGRNGFTAKCARCHFRLSYRLPNSRARTLAFSLAALILYFPSNFYPIITADYHGLHSETTVFQGIKALFTHHQYFIASLVFCTSLLTPALKILALLFIPLTLDWPRWKRARTRLTRSSAWLTPGTCWKCFCSP
jgi:paraquat-inducible protein A